MIWLLLAKIFAPSLETLLNTVVTAATNTQSTSTTKAADLHNQAADLLAQASDHTAKAARATNVLSSLQAILG